MVKTAERKAVCGRALHPIEVSFGEFGRHAKMPMLAGRPDFPDGEFVRVVFFPCDDVVGVVGDVANQELSRSEATVSSNRSHVDCWLDAVGPAGFEVKHFDFSVFGFKRHHLQLLPDLLARFVIFVAEKFEGTHLIDCSRKVHRSDSATVSSIVDLNDRNRGRSPQQHLPICHFHGPAFACKRKFALPDGSCLWVRDVDSQNLAPEARLVQKTPKIHYGKTFRSHLYLDYHPKLFHVGLSCEGNFRVGELASASIVEAELPRVSLIQGGVPHDEISIAVCKLPYDIRWLGGLAQSEVAISPVFSEAKLVEELVLFFAVGGFLGTLAQVAAKNNFERSFKYNSLVLNTTD